MPYSVFAARRPQVGIDLAPAEQSGAAGTARLVTEQARALSRLDVPWDWVPLVRSPQNPLWPEYSRYFPEVGGSPRTSVRSSLWNGGAWSRRRCDLVFATNGLAPFRGPTAVSNFFDANIYEFGDTWIRSGRVAGLLILRCLARVTVLRSRRLFILSHYGRDKMASVFPKASDRFVVVPGGVTELPPPPAETPAWAESLPPRFFVNVGVFSDNKNQPRLLEAWRQWQEVDPDAPGLALLGSGDEHFLASVIRPAAARLPHPERVCLPGRVSDADLAWAYSHALGCVQPSFAEGFGLPLVEAMSAGCAVACSRSTSLPETAGDAAIFFQPADPADIARAVQRLAADEPLRKELVQRGRLRSQVFTWEANAAAVAGEIESVLSTLKSAGPFRF